MRRAGGVFVCLLSMVVAGVGALAQPSDAPAGAKAAAGPPSMDAVAQFLQSYAAKKAEAEGGWMKVTDPKAQKQLALRLDKIHRDRLAKVGEGVYFVCADFKTPEGKVYDLDLWVKNAGDGLQVADTMIHKEAGEARYMWVERNGLWVRMEM